MKRSQAHHGAGNLQDALADLDLVLRLKPDHSKSSLKRLQLLLQLGRFQDVIDGVHAHRRQFSGDSVAVLTELLGKSSTLLAFRNQLNHWKAAQNWGSALASLESMEKEGASRDFLELEKCEILFASGQYYETVAEAMSILKRDSSHIPALLLRARAFFNLGELDAALNHLKQCLKVNPSQEDCSDEMEAATAWHATRTEYQRLLGAQDWAKAAPALKSALTNMPDIKVYQAEVHMGLCESLAKGGATIADWEEGVVVCGHAANLGASPEAMREMRGDLHAKLGKYSEAIHDFTTVLQSQPNNHRMRQRIQEMQNAKKLAERKDYYKILDLPRDCTKQQVKVQFRKMALVWHPDRFTKPEDLEKANSMFQDINEAYDVLTDPEKKARYDRGEDVDQQPQQHHHGFNPFGGGFGGGQFHFKFN